jgi:hypothetical protein
MPRSRYTQGRADANRLFDWIREEYNFPTDAKMANALHLDFTLISKYRSGKELLSSLGLLAVHEFTGLHLKTILEKAQG